MKRGYKIVRKLKAGLDPVKTPTPIDIAWAAGLYEGEGSCVAGGHHKKSFSAQVSQKDPEILYKLRDWFGGGVRPYMNGGFSIYHWTCCGDRGRVFIASIYHYLSARRKIQVESTIVKDFIDIVHELASKEQQAEPCTIYLSLCDAIKDFSIQQRQLAREHTKKRLAEFDKLRQQDPVRVARRKERRRATQQAWREKKKALELAKIADGTSRFKTVEERDADRAYQQMYYQQKKRKASSGVVIQNSSLTNDGSDCGLVN